MTRQEQLALIRQKCIEAKPELAEAKDCDCSFHEVIAEHVIVGRPIRLADVLLAMAAMGCVTYGSNKLINILDVNAPDIRWNLRKDDLTEQSDECVAFLYELLK